MVQVIGFRGDTDSIESNINKWINDSSPEKIVDIKMVEITKTTLNEPEFFALVLFENP